VCVGVSRDVVAFELSDVLITLVILEDGAVVRPIPPLGVRESDLVTSSFVDGNKDRHMASPRKGVGAGEKLRVPDKVLVVGSDVDGSHIHPLALVSHASELVHGCAIGHDAIHELSELRVAGKAVEIIDAVRPVAR